MDKHNVGRGRDSVRAALQSIKAKALVISISSDVLFPTSEQELLSAYIPNAQLAIIDSYYGHDGFLLEFETIENLVREFINQHTIELKLV
jgi:homoserine O-acetyltransferase